MQLQVAEITRFLSDLPTAEFESPCPDAGAGSTVRAVVAHVAAAYGRATMILRTGSCVGTPHGVPPRAGGLTGSGHRPEPAEPDLPTLIEQIRVRGNDVVQLVRTMPESALRQPFPGEEFRSAHVGKPFSMIIEYMIYQQAAHLDAVRRAVAEHHNQRTASGSNCDGHELPGGMCSAQHDDRTGPIGKAVG